MSDQDTSKISRYLLGELAPAEMDTVESRLLTEPGLFELAESVESEVIDRYVRGEMTPDEERRFERRLLPSRRIQERVAFARALAFRRRARRGEPTRRRSGTLLPFFRSPARLAWAATLVAAIVAGALAFEVADLREDREELERSHAAAMARLEEERRGEALPAPVEEAGVEDEAAERLAGELAAARERIAELEAGEAAGVDGPARIVEIRDDAATLSLFLSMTTRAGAAPETVHLGELGEEKDLELQLDLGGRPAPGPVAATLFRGGAPVYREPRVPVESVEGESMARLVVPRETLLAGRYRVELSEGGDEGPLLGTYEFSVVR